MTLSIEEINRQLEEYPHDLSVWREYLSYCRRHDLSHDRYLDYLDNNALVILYKHTWYINKGKDLDVLSGVFTTDLESIILANLELESTKGLEDLIAPNFKELWIGSIQHIELTACPTILNLYDNHITLSNTIDLTSLTKLQSSNSQISNMDKIYDAINLEDLSVENVNTLNSRCFIPKISKFKKLKNFSTGTTDELKQFGDSKSLISIRSYGVEPLVDKGWYPNLEYPIKGINKR